MNSYLTALVAFILIDDDEIVEHHAHNNTVTQCSFNLPPQPIYESISGTDLFETFSGVSEFVFNYLLNALKNDLIGNHQSRYKLSIENRLLCFLCQIRENPNVNHCSMLFGISPGQLSKNFHRISMVLSFKVGSFVD